MRKDAVDGRYVAEIGIAIAVERLLRAGFNVAMPIVDDGYDLLALSGRRYWRIQVKATSSDGRNGSRIRVRRGAKKTGRYSPKDVDAFLLVHTRHGHVLCVPVSHVTGSWVTFKSLGRYSSVEVLRTIKA